MQYLDDELCNQICGLLINIHMEDRSKELEKKEMENSGLFKSSKAGQGKKEAGGSAKASQNLAQVTRSAKAGKAGGISNPEDLLTAEDDLAIDQNNMLEQYTLQKITMEWLNWNAQFFDYSDPRSGEPYLYYLADILSKDFSKDSGNLMYTNTNSSNSTAVAAAAADNIANKNMLYTNTLGVNKKFLKLFKNQSLSRSVQQDKVQGPGQSITDTGKNGLSSSASYSASTTNTKLANGLEIYYGPFRLLANFAANNTYLPLSEALGFAKLSKPLTVGKNLVGPSTATTTTTGEQSLADGSKLQQLANGSGTLKNFNKLFNLTGDYAKQKLLSLGSNASTTTTTMDRQLNHAGGLNHGLLNRQNGITVLKDQPENALGQRLLKREYLQDRVDPNTKVNKTSNKTGANKLVKGHSSTIGLQQSAISNSRLDATGSKNNFKLDLESYAAMPFGTMGAGVAGTATYGAQQELNTALGSLNQYNRKVVTKAASNTMSGAMSLEEESKKVFVIINSFGGSVGNGITVHDALQFIKAGSLTLGLGVAASAASLVLAGGTIGERYVTEGCHVMIHQPESGLNGQASDIWIDANEIMKIRLDVAEIYSLSTYRPRHKILRDLDRDFYLTATETIQYGLADEIATNEVMSQIVEMTSKAWYEVDAQQQRLLESVVHRVDRASGLDTGSQTARP